MARCLILTQCFPPRMGGIEGMMGGFADTLSAQGHEVTVLADSTGEADEADYDAGRAYRVRRFGGWKPLRRRSKARAAINWLKDADSGEAFLFADSWKSLEHLPESAKGMTRIGCLMHGTELPATTNEKKAARIRSSLAKADRLISNSAYTIERAKSYLQDDVAPVIVHPPIEVMPKASGAALDQLRALLGRGPIVITICRLEERKGVDQAIRAVSALKKTHPGLALAIGGDGEDRLRLEEIAKSLSAPAVFLGPVFGDAKAALLETADVYLMPSRSVGESVEGFGISYIEAGWYGTPSIAGSGSGAAEAVIDGETGLVCDGRDLDQVTGCLERLLGDADLRARLGAAAQARAQTMTWPNAVALYLDALKP